MTDNKETFIKDMKSLILDEDYSNRDLANVALLGYDLGRSISKINEKNALFQYEIRFWSFVQENGISEGYKLARKFNTRNK